MLREISSSNVVYVDRRVRQEKIISHSDPIPKSTKSEESDGESLEVEHHEVVQNIKALLTLFSSVSLYNNGSTCLSVLNEISTFDVMPTLLLIDIPSHQVEDDDAYDNDRTDSGIAPSVEDQLYGLSLLRHVAMEMDAGSIAPNVVPVAFVGFDLLRENRMSRFESFDKTSWTAMDEEQTTQMSRILDTGAVDVLSSPFSKQMMKNLSTHCYRTAKLLQKRRTERKRSWVGVDADLEEEERQRKNNVRVAEGYAYLREKMVSELMRDIFKPSGPKQSSSHSKIRLAPSRLDYIKEFIGRWDFSAHEFSDDELLQCAFFIFQHAFTMPEISEWRIPSGQLTDFLYASRKAYNEQVPYHNFRHVVDVLQAIFYFLLALGALPHYTESSSSPRPKKHEKSLSSILRPFDALTLLIVAIGHDVGHPGVSNAFLVTLKAPLAQMYNDRSVLESFHCAAFSQVLRKHWSITQGPEMRRLMIESILATDMGLHFDYMNQLDKLTKKLEADGGSISSWDEKTTTANRSLLCTLLVKCADICNVARIDDIAAQWAMILTDEFSRQSSLETDLKIKSTLPSKPVKGSCLALARSQIGFINLFAGPLFKGVADVMPEMAFGIEEITRNVAKWTARLEECNAEGDRPFVISNNRAPYSAVNGTTPGRPAPLKLDDSPRISNGGPVFAPLASPLRLSRRSSVAVEDDPDQGVPDSSENTVVAVVVTNSHKSNGQGSPVSVHSQGDRYRNGKATAANLSATGPSPDQKRYKHSQNPYLPQLSSQAHHAVSATSLTPPSLSDSEDRPRSSPPTIGETQLPKAPATIAVRHTRSRFNLNKLFRRRKTDASAPKVKIEL